MPKYNEKHHNVTGTIQCEVFPPDDEIVMQARFLITPHVIQSYICNDLISSETGNWKVKNGKVSLTLGSLRSMPWHKKYKDDVKIEFKVQDSKSFNYVEKRELPEALRVHLASIYHVADVELLWPHDKNLPIHGTIGSDALKLLWDQKKAMLAPGLRIRSTRLGDYLYGWSHTCKLPASDISKKLGEIYANRMYLEMVKSSHVSDDSLPKKDELFFPEWTYDKEDIEQLIQHESVATTISSQMSNDEKEDTAKSSHEKDSRDEQELNKVLEKETLSFEPNLAQPGRLTNDELNRKLRMVMDQQMQEFKEWDCTTDEHNKKILQTFKENRKRLPDGRYQVCLPWNEKVEQVSSNEKLALDRLKILTRRFRNDPEFYGRYKDAIEELKELEVIKKVNIDFVRKAKKAVFFPHHCVSRPERLTTKDRVVWDGGAHEKGKEPINGALEEGPNLLPPLQCMLLLCRQGKYLVTGDLKKAFFQVALDPEDKILLFMYWYEENPTTKLFEFNIYWFVRLPWGLNCSPFILQAAIKFHGEDHLDRIGIDHEDYSCLAGILKSLYIDDLIKPEDAFHMVSRVIEIAKKYLEDGGWQLVKLRTNCKEVNDLLGIDSESIEGIKLIKQKVLGIIYDIMTDTLKPNVTNVLNMDLTKPFTRRTALGAFSMMYDPLRLFAPWLFTGQLLFQKTLRHTHDWDTVLNEELQDEWTEYLKSHNILENVTINREAVPFEEDFDVHIFADACGEGYATVAYSVWPERNTSDILIAMTRIVPDKLKEHTTINRLELNGAVLATLIANKIQTTFNKVKVNFTYWLDSMVSLWWIHGNKTNYQVYITNRVRAILESSEASQWRHVPGKLNPADHASRGIGAEKLKALHEWFHGPEFLLDKSKWPPEFNKSVKPSEEVMSAIYAEEVPCVEMLVTDPLPIATVQALINDKIAIEGKPATFLIQVGNSPLEREIPRTPHRSKIYDNVVRSLVYVARSWSHKQKVGKLRPIIEAYNSTSPFATEPFKKEWDIWKKSLFGYSLSEWVKIDTLAVKKWAFRDKEKQPNPLICSMRTNYVKDVNPPPHHRSDVDPIEKVVAEEVLIRDVQQHYFSAIYLALLEVKRSLATPDEAYKRLTSEDKALVNKHQIIMDSREILVAIGRFITPKKQEEEDENKRSGYHRDLVHVMEEYFHVNLGRKSSTETAQVYAWDSKETIERESSQRKRTHDWVDERTNQWLEDNSSVTRVLILIPNRGLVAESIMRQSHNNSGHAGINYTMRLVNQKFWIAKPTKLYNHVKNTCFMCRFFANKLWQIQEGLLPDNKIVPTRPFQYVGIDIAGPLFYKSVEVYKLVMDRSKSGKEALLKMDPEDTIRQDPSKKHYYVLLFVCAVTRAVNFQLLKDQTAESIVPAFETFCHEEGIRPSYVLSDNASDFERTSNILKTAIKKSLSSSYANTRWAFIPSRTPWWGGQYEVFVRLLKVFLTKNMPLMKVTGDLQAHHFIKAAQGVVNSRPLYAIPSGINDLEVTTPNHFKSVPFNIEEKYFPLNINLTTELYKQLRRDQTKQLREMWRQFHEEYLTHMRKFHVRKGCFSKKPIKVGDIVLIKKEQVARNFWPLAKVVKVTAGKRDGYIRTVMVQKYLPFSINAALRRSLHNTDSNQDLTEKQVQHLTGYFEDMRHTQSVENLVPYELWKGDQAEPEDMDTGQVGCVEVSFGNTIIQGSALAFYAMGIAKPPTSQIHQFLTPNSVLMERPADKWTGSSTLDSEFHENILLAWEILDESS